MAAFRKPVINLFYDREIYDEYVPGINTAAAPFVRFTIFMVLTHLTLLFFIESFTLFNLLNTVIRIISSSIISILLILALDGLTYRKKAGEQ